MRTTNTLLPNARIPAGSTPGDAPRRWSSFLRLLEIHQLEVPPYKFFYYGKEPPKKPRLSSAEKTEPLWGTSVKEWPELRKFAKALSQMDNRKRRLLLATAQRMAGRNRS
jgi:hypothetical protein